MLGLGAEVLASAFLGFLLCLALMARDANPLQECGVVGVRALDAEALHVGHMIELVDLAGTDAGVKADAGIVLAEPHNALAPRRNVAALVLVVPRHISGLLRVHDSVLTDGVEVDVPDAIDVPDSAVVYLAQLFGLGERFVVLDADDRCPWDSEGKP
jgi:hypothetical protein